MPLGSAFNSFCAVAKGIVTVPLTVPVPVTEPPGANKAEADGGVIPEMPKSIVAFVVGSVSEKLIAPAGIEPSPPGTADRETVTEVVNVLLPGMTVVAPKVVTVFAVPVILNVLSAATVKQLFEDEAGTLKSAIPRSVFPQETERKLNEVMVNNSNFLVL